LFCYVDDTYGWEDEVNTMLYRPYNRHFPMKQALLLYLWDFLGIPHKCEKQLFGFILVIISFQVDPNAMTITLPSESKEDLIRFIQHFILSPSRWRTLHKFQMLSGWVNWSFNVFPLLHPCLCNVYNKMKGKNRPDAPIYLNKAVKDDLTWFINHIRRSQGTLIFDGMDWNPYLECDMTI
ncbi:hypothetical protein GYMLUDRAFT_112360, partial [Collybiopsis luxurians FD-317 M1]